MSGSFRCVWVTVTASVVMGALAVSAPGVSGAATGAGQASGAVAAARPVGPGTSGAQLWVQRYARPGTYHFSSARALAVSPGGGKVFVTGYSSPGVAATIAYNSVTGARLWLARYPGPAGPGRDSGAAGKAIAAGPGGRTVFAVASTGRNGLEGSAAIAYDAATGRRLWLARTEALANSIAVSPDGSTVFVTGAGTAAGSRSDYATIAYSAVTGRLLWTASYDGPASGNDYAAAIAVSPDGGLVYVTGQSQGPLPLRYPGYDYATVAYSAATGQQLWARRYASAGARMLDMARAVAVGRGGQTVLVTGSSAGAAVTIAYSPAGQRVWLARYQDANGAGAWSKAISPSGNTAFVTGALRHGYTTIAYGIGTGRRLWVSVYQGPRGGGEPAGVAVSPDGTRVYVTGNTGGPHGLYDYGTVAYRSASGARLWVRRYDGPASNDDYAAAIAVGPGGGLVFVTGESFGAGDGRNNAVFYATVAYRA